jgi:hypothetical protein
MAVPTGECRFPRGAPMPHNTIVRMPSIKTILTVGLIAVAFVLVWNFSVAKAVPALKVGA